MGMMEGWHPPGWSPATQEEWEFKPLSAPVGRPSDRMDTDVSEPDTAALSLTIAYMLREAIEAAGAVRDLVYTALTQEGQVTRNTTAYFARAMDTVFHTRDVTTSFQAAFNAVSALPHPGAKEIGDVIQEQVGSSIGLITHHSGNQALADAYGAAFPDRVLAIAGHPTGRADREQAVAMSVMYRTAVPTLPGMQEQDGGAARKRATGAAALRAVSDAVTPAFPLAAAASAIMMESIPDYRIAKYLRRATGLKAQLTESISSMGGIPLESASVIPDVMFKGAAKCRNGPESKGEAVVRALRTAHMWTSMAAATATFCTLYGLTAGAAWKASGDRERFESAYEQAVRAAGRMDMTAHLAFERIPPHTEDGLEISATDDVWEFFYSASGRSMAEWTDVALGIDYRAVADSPENAPLMDSYKSAYDVVRETITRACS